MNSGSNLMIKLHCKVTTRPHVIKNSKMILKCRKMFRKRIDVFSSAFRNSY